MFHKLVLSLKYMATTATPERALLNSKNATADIAPP